MNKNKILTVILLGIITFLSISLFFSQSKVNNLHTTVNGYINDSTYMVTYYSKTIKELKKENTDLYNRIKNQSNISSALQFKWTYTFKTDTVRTDPNDTSEIKVYSVKNDTINYDLHVKAKQIEWYILNFQVNDKFTIINRKDGDSNETQITNTNNNANVSDVTTFTPKEKKSFLHKFVVGPQIGMGMSITPNQSLTPQFFVGIGITYNLF